METTLSLVSGIFWTITYIVLIYISFRDKTYGMPLIALALNISWEAIYAWLEFAKPDGGIQKWINLVWFVFDLVLVVLYFRYGSRYFNSKKGFFVPWSLLMIVMSFVLQFSFVFEFGKYSSWYSAFIQNLIMSVAFVMMFNSRKSSDGQNLIIAVSKCIGTVAPTILFGVIYANQLVLCLGIFCFVFDLIYIAQLTGHRFKQPGKV